MHINNVIFLILSKNAYTKFSAGPHRGTLLPSTGGMGTTIFYVLGSILVLGAGVLLVARKRMGAER